MPRMMQLTTISGRSVSVNPNNLDAVIAGKTEKHIPGSVNTETVDCCFVYVRGLQWEVKETQAEIESQWMHRVIT